MATPTIAPPGTRRPSLAAAAAPFLDFQPPAHYSQANGSSSSNAVSLGMTSAQMAAVTLDMAMRDTPAFRASLSGFEAELEGISRWLEGLIRGGKAYADELGRSNDVVVNLIQRMRNRRRISILDSTVVHTFSEALQTVCALRSKLLETLNLDLISLIQKFVREDIKEMKDYDKVHAKVTEKYDSALIKYASLPKTKESSALREDAFILFEARKLYIRSSIEYANKILVFKNNIEMLIVDRLMGMMYAHGAFFETSSDVFKGLKPSMNALKTRLEEARKTLPTPSEIESKKRSLEEEAISRANPGQPLTNSISATDLSSLANDKETLTPNSVHLMVPAVAAAAAAAASASFAGVSGCQTGIPTEKEGHLFRRVGTGTKGWTRCYVILQEGLLWIQTIKHNSGAGNNAINVDGLDMTVDSVLSPSGGGLKAGKLVTIGPISVLLCGTRVDKSLERRFCFEIYTPMKSFSVQAETEKEMYEWIAAIEAAKASQIAPHTASRFQSGGETTDAEEEGTSGRGPKHSISLPLGQRETVGAPGLRPATVA
ncbi:SNF1-interacting protein, partial [Dinochytrium kinnereticum]